MAVTCDATYSRPPSQRTSDRLFARLSTTVAVNDQVGVALERSRRAMRQVAVGACHRTPHQLPSWNQSLLSGFSPVGALPAPAVDGPAQPSSTAAEAGEAQPVTVASRRALHATARARTSAADVRRRTVMQQAPRATPPAVRRG